MAYTHRFQIGTNITYRGRRGAIQHYAAKSVKGYKKTSAVNAILSGEPFVAVYFYDTRSTEFVPYSDVKYAPPWPLKAVQS